MELMILLLILFMLLIVAITKFSWIAVIAAIFWAISTISAAIMGIIHFTDPSYSRLGTLVCCVESYFAIRLLIWLFT